jgi:hypothetical protein
MELSKQHLHHGASKHAMGESQCSLFQPDFNRSLRVEARGERLSADAGALLLRELLDRLGYPTLFSEHLRDARDGSRVRHAHEELLRTALLLLAQGWRTHSDVSLLREDPAFRLAISSRRGQRPLRQATGREPNGLCSQPTLSRLLAALSSEKNRGGLAAVLLESAARRMNLRERLPEITLDLDSLPIEVFGHQPGSDQARGPGRSEPPSGAGGALPRSLLPAEQCAGRGG